MCEFNIKCLTKDNKGKVIEGQPIKILQVDLPDYGLSIIKKTNNTGLKLLDEEIIVFDEPNDRELCSISLYPCINKD